LATEAYPMVFKIAPYPEAVVAYRKDDFAPKFRRPIPMAVTTRGKPRRIRRLGQPKKDGDHAGDERRFSLLIGAYPDAQASGKLGPDRAFVGAKSRERDRLQGDGPAHRRASSPAKACKPRSSARRISFSSSGEAATRRAPIRRTNAPRTVGSSASCWMSSSARPRVSSTAST